MFRKSLGRSAAVVSVAAVVGSLLAGCGHKSAQPGVTPPSNTKMGNDYAQGLVKMHAQQSPGSTAGHQ